MAPKPNNQGVLGLFLWPFTFALKCVFYPADWIMWFLIDFIGAEVIRKEKVLNENGDVVIHEHREYWLPYVMGLNKSDKAGGIKLYKDVTRYLKEFRYVLYEWNWPRVPSPAWRCKGCWRKSEWYCVDCGKRYCGQCSYNLHAPGMFSSNHSIEKLEDRWRRSHHFITPIVPELMVLCVAIKLGYFTQVYGEDYLASQMICPVVTEMRHIVGYVETNLVYYYKDSFFSWCNYEDSYMRFIMDTWVRTIVTRTDNALLIFQMFPKALVFNVVIMYTLVPVVSVVYALIVNVTYLIECALPDHDVFDQLEIITRRLSISEKFAESNRTLPETLRRRRSSTDYFDHIYYEYQRKVRVFKFYYSTCQEGLSRIFARVLTLNLVFRLGCFYFGLAKPIRAVCRIIPGLGSTMSIHERWYARTKDMFISEPFLVQAAIKAWRFAPRELKEYTFSLWKFAVVAVLVCVYLIHRIVMDRRNNDRIWRGDGPTSESKVVEFGQVQILVERRSSW